MVETHSNYSQAVVDQLVSFDKDDFRLTNGVLISTTYTLYGPQYDCRIVQSGSGPLTKVEVFCLR